MRANPHHNDHKYHSLQLMSSHVHAHLAVESFSQIYNTTPQCMPVTTTYTSIAQYSSMVHRPYQLSDCSKQSMSSVNFANLLVIVSPTAG
jgi:hypothetical protein